ncbi:MAG: DUF6036 family nucleotidyltransferase [Gemmatimonadota bacterium]
MRELVDSERIARFMRALGRAADEDGACYFAGGATAVLFGWRQSTIDVDVLLVPETEALLRAIQQLKDELQVNVELVSPVDFIPVPPGWEDRSIFVAREGRLSFFHIDLLAQAFAKLERAHAQDLDDIAAMLERGLVDRDAAFVYFEQIEPELYRFPAIDPATFRARAEKTFGPTAR